MNSNQIVSPELPEVNQDFIPRRRMGRGRLVLVEAWGRGGTHGAELDPESTTLTDQRLTEINLRSADSDDNEAIRREQAAAIDRLDHILEGVTPTARGTLERELERETGPEPYRSERARACGEARRADKFEFFRDRGEPPVAYRPYNPRGVLMEDYNRTPGEPSIPFFGLDQRTSVGIDRSRRVEAIQQFTLDTTRIEPIPTPVSDERPTPPTSPYPPSNGCEHQNRKLRVVRYGYLAPFCTQCGEEFGVRFVLAP